MNEITASKIKVFTWWSNTPLQDDGDRDGVKYYQGAFHCY